MQHSETEDFSNTGPIPEFLKTAITRCRNRMKKQHVQRVYVSYKTRVEKVVQAGGDNIQWLRANDPWNVLSKMVMIGLFQSVVCFLCSFLLL